MGLEVVRLHGALEVVGSQGGLEVLHQRCLADRVAVRSRSRILMIVVQWDSPERSCRWGSSALWLSNFCDLACNRPHQRGHGDGVAGRSGSQICMIWATVGFTRGVWATVGSAVVGLSSKGLSMSSGAHGSFSATPCLVQTDCKRYIIWV